MRYGCSLRALLICALLASAAAGAGPATRPSSAVRQGQLQWKQREVTLKPTPKDKQVQAEFEFANAGTEPVTITDIVTSCGSCTAVPLQQYTYKPGESGKLIVRVAISDQVGEQRKTVLISTNDRKESRLLLTLKLQFPQPLRVEPRFLIWRKGEEMKPKAVRIKVTQEEAVVVSGLLPGRSKGGAIQAELKEVQAGREYTVMVTPSAVNEAGMASWELQTNLPRQKRVSISLYAVVEGGTAAAPATQPSRGGGN